MPSEMTDVLASGLFLDLIGHPALSFSSLLHQSLSLDSHTEEIINIKMKGMASPYEGARQAALSDGRIISVKLKCFLFVFLSVSEVDHLTTSRDLVDAE